MKLSLVVALLSAALLSAACITSTDEASYKALRQVCDDSDLETVRKIIIPLTRA